MADVGVVRVSFTIVAIVGGFGTFDIVVLARQTSNAFGGVTVRHCSSIFVVGTFGTTGAGMSPRFFGRIRTGRAIEARYLSGRWLLGAHQAIDAGGIRR